MDDLLEPAIPGVLSGERTGGSASEAHADTTDQHDTKRPRLADQSEMLAIREPDQRPSLNNQKTKKYTWLGATIKVGDNAFLGNQFESINGYSVRVAFDGGQDRRASVSLKFRINKDTLQKAVNKRDDEAYQLTIRFKFNLLTKIPGDTVFRRSVTQYDHRHIDPATADPDDAVAIAGYSEKLVDRLWSMRLTACHMDISEDGPPHVPDIAALGNNDLACSLSALLMGLPQDISIWFCASPKIEDSILQPLRKFYTDDVDPCFLENDVTEPKDEGPRPTMSDEEYAFYRQIADAQGINVHQLKHRIRTGKWNGPHYEDRNRTNAT